MESKQKEERGRKYDEQGAWGVGDKCHARGKYMV